MMGKHEQFETALRTIQGRRIAAQSALERRAAEIDRTIPAVAEINQRLSGMGLALYKIMQRGEHVEEQIEAIRKQNLEGQALLKAALTANGYPADYLELHYTCPICEDTGYVRDGYCTCLKQECHRLAIAEMNRCAQLQLCSFSSFSTAYYQSGGSGCLATMEQILAYCKQYAAQFSLASPSLLMIGKTGLGKTHLSLAIAQTLLERGFHVLYDSTINILRRVEKEHFRRTEAEADTLSLLLSCDLLILDDLGTEFDTSFYVSMIYTIINTRLNRGLPTIISTNLTHEEVQKKYEDRIVSRLFAAYECLAFSGTDIRLQKRKNGL